MARSRREQSEQLQTAMQSKPQEKSISDVQTPSASTRAFSQDPSPFSQRPEFSPDSSAYRELVAIAAYYRAERRGFAPGGEIEDWLQAEREVAAQLNEPRAN